MMGSGSEIGKRKRLREDFEAPPSRQRKNDAANDQVVDDDEARSAPLEGVVACLSGFEVKRKDELHRLILDLGGRFSRELDLDKNTHLITETAMGAKYKLASSLKPPVIKIVTPSWLHSTEKSGRRARETDHALVESNMYDSLGNGKRATISSPRDHLSLTNDALLEGDHDCTSDLNLSRSFLYKNQHFFLLGFEGNLELKNAISKLIRRGSGTIYWDMNEDITILLLCDGCDDSLRKAAKIVSSHHSNFPPMVSPLWVIESYRLGKLQSVSAYPPNEEVSKPTMKGAKNPSKISLSSTTSNVSIFRGCLFSLARSSVPIEDEQSECVNSDIIEFDSKDLEALITAHGGQILSNKLLGALRADEGNNDGSPRRKCHVVCWGKAPPRLESNPLISRLQRRNLCEIILVTPIWVQASISAKRRIQLNRVPLILVPQSWPMKSVTKIPSQPQMRLDMALTGFQGSEKLAIIHLIDAMGAVYHESMSSGNTHLIFKKNPSGLKLEKAMEWGLHIVSIKWLYHILKYGYGGVRKEEDGCEKRFSFDVVSRENSSQKT